MPISALPTPPTRSDPATFAARGDAFMTALPTFVSEANALQITTNAQTAADAAASATSAAEAVVAKNAAIAAWAASMSPAETLPALSQSLHIGAIVKAIVYDTSADSDGGAWRKRCAGKSWYTETLGGDRWIGQHATIAAAWTAAGSTTGAVYQASATAGSQTSGLYYTPTSSTTVTQVYRGVTREFPAVAGIVAESARVVIYDLSAVGCPMWMVFVANNSNFARSTTIASLAALNGKLCIAGNGGFSGIDFIRDGSTLLTTGGTYTMVGSMTSRNASLGFGSPVSPSLVNSTVNDVAITVLDTAPIDPATGLPVPTIAVATAGGVSVIKDDGTVVTWSGALTDMSGCTFTDTGLFLTRKTAATSQAWSLDKTYNALVKQYDSTTVPAMPIAVSGQNQTNPRKLSGSSLASAYSTGLTLLRENPATPTKGMVSYITSAYNTGWLPGDIRGAYLADTTAETVTASGELVTNGTFTTDTSGWADVGTGSSTVVSNEAQVTHVSGTEQRLQQTIATVVGKTYQITSSLRKGTSSGVQLFVNSGTDLLANVDVSGSTTVGTITFVAGLAATTVWVRVYSAGTGFADNISVKLAEPDRCIKNKGLVINGSLTKTAVASGAGLVAWSGFSAANYCEQPYNSDLDFGTGDFCVMGWVNATVTARLYARGIVAGALAMAIDVVPSTGTVNIYKSSGFWLASSASAFTSGQTFLLCVSRTSGTVTISVNGVVVATATSDTTNLTLTNAVTRFGVALDGTTPLTSGRMALWRISATAPSADQIAHIYRTELPLFQASAQCTIAGSSTAVTALAYDDTTELLHVGTSWGRTGFKDLLRVDSEATTTGALTSLSASQGVIITGGTSGKVYVPAMLLRDELRRKDEARKALGKVPVFFDYTATASQTAFVAPKGYTIKAVYHNGTLKRETTTGVYWTRSSDGFAETCTLSAGATVSDWISLMCVRT